MRMKKQHPKETPESRFRAAIEISMAAYNRDVMREKVRIALAKK